MAEFAASILGIVSCGAKVTFVLSQIASDVGSAGKEARMIGSEIRSFCAIIKTLGDTLGKIQASQYYEHCADLIQPMTETSMEMFTEILNASDQLKGITKGKEKKEDNFSLVRRVQWAVFQKPKIMVLRAAIEAYKSNLALMLATLNTAEKVARVMPTQMSEDLIREEENDRSLLQSLALEHRASILELEEAEQEYRKSVTDQTLDFLSYELRGVSPASGETSPVVSQSPGEKTWIEDLVETTREEIVSIRSSLTSNYVFDIAEIQGQVSRQSKTLSLLLAEEHQRISQRWSSVLSLSIRLSNHAQIIDGSKAPETDEHSSDEDGAGEVPAFGSEISLQPGGFEDPFYRQVAMWLMQYPKADRATILKSLEEEVSRPLVKLPIKQETKRSKTGLPETQKARRHDRKHPQLGSQLNPQNDSKPDPQIDPQLPTLPDHRDTPGPESIRHMVKQQVISYKSQTWSSPYVEVDLSNMRISEVPGHIFLDWNHRLTRIDLSHNRLTSLPREINSSHFLRHLVLKNNEFREFPPVILWNHTLEHLDVSHNKLQSLPDVSHMSALKVLSIEHNYIRGLPLAIGNMPRLNLLRYGGNQIYFPSPKAIEAFMPSRYVPTAKSEDEACIYATKRVKAFLNMTYQLSPDAERAVKGINSNLLKLPIDPESAKLQHIEDASAARTEPLNRVSKPKGRPLHPIQSDTKRRSGLWSPPVTVIRPPAEGCFDFPSFAYDKPPDATAEKPEHTPLKLDSNTGLIPIGLGHRKAQSHDVSNRGPTVFPRTDGTAARRSSYGELAPASASSLSDVPSASGSTREPADVLRSHKSRPSLNELLNRAKRRP